MSSDAPNTERDDEAQIPPEAVARPDIQAGMLNLSEGDEPEVHEHPSYREAADESSEGGA